MNLTFFIKSATVSLDNYTIKDIPGSSGRLDVISRCILAALLKKDYFDLTVKIWVFLDNYGTLVFDPQAFNYEIFPKNELRFTNCLVDLLLKKLKKEDIIDNPLRSVQKSGMSIIEAIKKFQKLNYNQFILKEDGKDFFEFRFKIEEMNDILFIIGSQEDDFLDSDALLALKIPTISFGTSSYLASSVIRLLKLHILELQ
jgi:tRNA (pseudouridine54-N1)-methyltransferase